MPESNTLSHYPSMRRRIGLGTATCAGDHAQMHNKDAPKTPLDRLMRDREIGANELSRRTKVPQPTITRIRNGDSKQPKDSNLRKLAAYFGVHVDVLRGVEDPPKADPALRASEPLVNYSALSLDIAARWMTLSPERQEWFRDLIFTMAFVEGRFPAMRKGRPRGERYTSLEAAIENDFRQLQLFQKQ